MYLIQCISINTFRSYYYTPQSSTNFSFTDDHIQLRGIFVTHAYCTLTAEQLTFSRVKIFIANIQNTHRKHTKLVTLKKIQVLRKPQKDFGLICLRASPRLLILQYLLCLGEKMVLGLLSRSLSFSRSF